MRRIGVLLESNSCAAALADVIGQLSALDNVEVGVLVTHSRKRCGVRLRCNFSSASWMRTSAALRQAIYSWYAWIEKMIYRLLLPDVRLSTRRVPVDALDGVTVFNINPKSGTALGQPCQGDLVGAKFDLLIAGPDLSSLPRAALEASSGGVVRVLYGGERIPTWILPCVAVTNRAPSTRFVIEHREPSDGLRRVCVDGNVATRVTITRNRLVLDEIAYRQLGEQVHSYATHGRVETRELPLGADVPTDGGDALLVLGLGKLVGYLARTLRRLVATRKPKGEESSEKWHVGYSGNRNGLEGLEQATLIENPQGRAFADPFVVEWDDRTVCFVEDISLATGRGCVSAIELFGDGGYEVLGPVIQEPFHMSFPFTFEHEGQLYMVPETSERGQVRLYACSRFPTEWRFVHALLEEVSVVDPVVFSHRDMWWLLCSLPVPGGTWRDPALHAFYCDSPVSTGWQQHEMNPLIIDNMSARNGGLLLMDDDLPIRVRQRQGFDSYGAGLSLARITSLSPSQFDETETDRSEVGSVVHLVNSHHLSVGEEWIATDFLLHPRQSGPSGD